MTPLTLDISGSVILRERIERGRRLAFLAGLSFVGSFAGLIRLCLVISRGDGGGLPAEWLIVGAIIIVALAAYAFGLSRSLAKVELGAIAVFFWFQLILLLLYVGGAGYLLWLMIGDQWFWGIAVFLGLTLYAWYGMMGKVFLSASKYAALTGLEPVVRSALDVRSPKRHSRNGTRTRTLFTGKNTWTVIALIGLSGLLFCAMIVLVYGSVELFFSRMHGGREGDGAWGLPLFGAAGPWLGIGAGLAGMLALRQARRYAAFAAQEVRQRDTRPPVLLLRSFADDDMPARGWWFNSIGGIIGVFTTFEEYIGALLRRYGPVVALGRPGERLPPLGVAVEYLRHEDWQAAVEERIAVARMIVAVVGETEGLAWEIRALARLNAIPHVMLVFPPQPQKELKARWWRFRRQVLGDRQRDLPHLDLPAELDLAKVLVLIVSGGDQPTVITGVARTRWDYEEAVDRAARLLLARSPANQSSSLVT
jgi:hypothetical protein